MAGSMNLIMMMMLVRLLGFFFVCVHHHALCSSFSRWVDILTTVLNISDLKTTKSRVTDRYNVTKPYTRATRRCRALLPLFFTTQDWMAALGVPRYGPAERLLNHFHQHGPLERFIYVFIETAGEELLAILRPGEGGAGHGRRRAVGRHLAEQA